MAKKKNDQVVEVKHEADGGQDWLDEQNAALMHYRLTGEAGVYVDPTRDQEPDIAPELGISPHPDIANPAPPAASFSGRALDVSQNPMLVPADEKEENAEEATEAFNEALLKREEEFKALQAGGASSGLPAQPVYVVESPEGDGAEGLTPVPADESPKSRDANPEAQVAQDLDADADK